MAKQAKEGAEVIFSKSLIDKSDSTIDEAIENMESARGRYMNACQKQRAQIAAVYEDLAARGISQRVSKLRQQARTYLRKYQSKLAELEAEDIKLLKRIAKTAGDKVQLSLFEGFVPGQGSVDDFEEDPPRKGADLADAEAAGSA